MGRSAVLHRSGWWGAAKDIVHVRAVLGPGAETSDVKLAQLAFLWQFNVMAEITVVSLEENHRKDKIVALHCHCECTEADNTKRSSG
jgi:hypothetical protein